MSYLKRGLIIGLLSAPVAGLGTAYAGSFTIVDGEVVTVTQELNAPGDVGIVESGGAIYATDVGIMASADHVFIDNAGVVSGRSDGVFSRAGGIAASAANSTIINSGRAEAYGTGTVHLATGIYGSSKSRVVNLGSAFAQSDGDTAIANGIWATHKSSILNVGRVSANASDYNSMATGIGTVGHSAIDNSGSVTARTNGSSSVASGISTAVRNVIRNSGAIAAEASGDGSQAFGVQMTSSNTVTNAGTIDSRASGDGALATGITGVVRNVITNLGTVQVRLSDAQSGIATGIRLATDLNTVVNQGAIDVRARGTSVSAYGISMQEMPVPGDPGNRVHNMELIRVVADGADSSATGIFGYLGNSVSNSGVIDVEATGSGSRAVGVGLFSEASVINAGKIRSSASGDGARSAALTPFWYSDVSNSGSVVSEAFGNAVESTGVLLAMGRSTADNSGTIHASASGDDARAYGINSNNLVDGDSITNTGVISATSSGKGSESYGIVATSKSTIANCGTLAGGTAALRFDGAGNTLNLCNGSYIEGALLLGDGNALNVDLGRGVNTALHYEGSPTVTVTGGPHAVSGNVIAVVDPTGLSAQDEMLTDLTRVIADGVDARLAAARSNRPEGAVALNGALVTPTADVPQGASGTVVFWASGIGQARSEDANGQDTGFYSQLGGLMLGADGELSAGVRAGVFLGASASSLETDTNSQTIDANSYFGGLYAGLRKGAPFLNLAVTAGMSDQNSNRSLNNNLVAGGTEHAEANYDGVFVSPAATLGTDIAIPGAVFTPSVRARYAALFLGDYEEHGSDADLSVDARTVQILDLRGQLAFAVPVEREGGDLSLTTRLGVDAAFASDSDAETQLIGETLNIPINSQDMAEGFAGLDIAYTTRGGTRFFVTTEFGLQQDASTTAQGAAGFEVRL